jgi:hypothetical protein
MYPSVTLVYSSGLTTNAVAEAVAAVVTVPFLANCLVVKKDTVSDSIFFPLLILESRGVLVGASSKIPAVQSDNLKSFVNQIIVIKY